MDRPLQKSRQIGARFGQLGGQGINFRRPFALGQIRPLGAGLVEILFGFPHRRRLGFPLQGKERLPGLHRVTAGHRQLGERSAQGGRNINILPLDVALKLPGVRAGTAPETGRQEQQREKDKFGAHNHSGSAEPGATLQNKV